MALAESRMNGSPALGTQHSEATIAPTARCLCCDYLLTGLAEPRCPECGRPFDPGNASTYRLGEPVTWAQRALVRRPGVLLHAAAVFGAMAILDPGSLPAERYQTLGSEWIYSVLLITGCVWFVKLAARIGAALGFQLRGFRNGVRAMAWFFLPACWIAAVAIAVTTDTKYLRAAISRPLMDHFARKCLALPPQAPLPQPDWVGLYPVYGVERAYGGIRFRLPVGGFCCNVEVAYSPGKVLTQSDGDHKFTRVTGDWYFTGWDW